MGRLEGRDLFLPDTLPEMIVAPRTDAIYNAHGYLTKVPVDAILPYINQFTNPGDLVVDMFAGSGMTAIAASILNRRALVSDISVLGQHVAMGYVAKTEAAVLRHEAKRVIAQASEHLGSLYISERASDKARVQMQRTIWSFLYGCPSCSAVLEYYELLRVSSWKSPTSCPSCGHSFSKSRFRYLGDRPVRVVVKDVNGKLSEQLVGSVDNDHIAKARALRKSVEIPSLSISPEREMYRRSALSKWNLSETADFFSDRNALALTFLHREIQLATQEPLRRKLLFAFTAILPRASRRYQWSPERPLNAANQNYYVAPVYYEWNVFDLYQRKIEAIIRADQEMHMRNRAYGGLEAGDVQYERASADDLRHLGDASVDYVFTDPPFGSNIFYSDMNLFQEAWLGDQTRYEREAVIHTDSNRRQRSRVQYAEILEAACKEAFRVLKPGRHMSMVFGNSKGSVWSMAQRALRRSGFEFAPTHIAVLDKGQRSVKGLNSGREGVATLDLIVTVRKPSGTVAVQATEVKRISPEEVLERSLNRANLRELPTPSHVYLTVLKEAMSVGIDLDDLHLADVLIALRRRGFRLDGKTGRLAPADRQQ